MAWRRRAAAALALALTALAGTTSACTSAGAERPGTVSIVASTNVYGDIATQLAGRLAGSRITITSIIADPDADPHSYEASTRDQLALSRADVIIENGGGYDDFIDTMRRAVDHRATVLNAVDISGKKAAGRADLNEHVFYDFPSMLRLADRLATVLATADPTDAGTLRANAARFAVQVHGLEATEARIRSTSAGRGVAITEPVPLYLLQACGLVNRTPPAFSQAVEDGAEVAPRVLQQTLDLISQRRVALIAYNEQASGRDTDQVLATARRHGVGIVPVSETLPRGKDYVAWMSDTLSAVAAALGRA